MTAHIPFPTCSKRQSGLGRYAASSAAPSRGVEDGSVLMEVPDANTWPDEIDGAGPEAGRRAP
jgi:hypothetical protein